MQRRYHQVKRVFAKPAQRRPLRIAAAGANRATRGYFFFGMYRSVIVPS